MKGNRVRLGHILEDLINYNRFYASGGETAFLLIQRCEAVKRLSAACLGKLALARAKRSTDPHALVRRCRSHRVQERHARRLLGTSHDPTHDVLQTPSGSPDGVLRQRLSTGTNALKADTSGDGLFRDFLELRPASLLRCGDRGSTRS